MTVAIAQGYCVNILMLVCSLISMLRPKRRRENAEIFDFLYAFFTLHCYNTIAIAQRYFANVLMLQHSIINVPRTERHRENAENFDFHHAFFALHCYNIIAITQVYFCQGFNAWSLCNSLATISMVPRQCLKFSFSHCCIIMIL